MPEPIKTLEELEDMARSYAPARTACGGMHLPTVRRGDYERLVATARLYLAPWKDADEEQPNNNRDVLGWVLDSLSGPYATVVSFQGGSWYQGDGDMYPKVLKWRELLPVPQE